MKATSPNDPDPRILAARLQNARSAAGLTQQQAADQMEMARTTVVAIEKGQRRLKPEELVRFAGLYHRPVSEFVGRQEVATGFAAQFRSSERELLSAHADFAQTAFELERLAADYAELEHIVGRRRSRDYPPVCETSGAGPEQIASEIAAAERHRLGLGDGPVGTLRERLDTDVGIAVFYFPMPSKMAGVFAYNQDLGACIGINARHPRDRRHWSLAHEYGHFLMHRYQAEITVLEARGRRTSKERAADAFAENFLMPASGLNRRFTQLHRSSEKGITLADIVSLASLYQVSVQALVLRLETLRRLPAGAWQRLAAEGFRVRQAQTLLGIDANPPPADLLPRRYAALATEAYHKRELSEGQLARYLRTDRVSARLQIEQSLRDIHQEADGEFTALDLDLALPLGHR